MTPLKQMPTIQTIPSKASKLPTKNPIATSLKTWCVFFPVFSNIKTHGGTHWAHHPLNWNPPLCLQRNFCWHLCCFSIHLISYTVSRSSSSTSLDFFTTSDSSILVAEIQIHYWLQNGTHQCQKWQILWYLLVHYFLSHRHRYILIVMSIPPPYEPPVRWTFLESKPLSRKCLKQMNAKRSWKWARTPGNTAKDVDKTTKKTTFVVSLICLTFLLFLKEWSLQWRLEVFFIL